MFVIVKTEIFNRPWSATPAPCSLSYLLNRVETLSAVGAKTCLNSSRGGLGFGFDTILESKIEHNWPACAGKTSC